MKRLTVIACIIIAATAAGWFALSRLDRHTAPFSDAQKGKRLYSLLGRDPNLAQQETRRTWKSYSGTHFTVEYPSDATVYPPETKQPVRESFLYGILNPHVLVSVQVFDASGLQGLAEYPAIRIRQTQPDTYEKGADELNGRPMLVFIKQKDGVEKSGFILSGGNIYSLAVSGPTRAAVEEYYSRTLHSFSLQTDKNK